MALCPNCKKAELKYYHGVLGYESFKCPVCNYDINDKNQKVKA